MEDRFTYITVFSGAGGSAIGLQQAGGEGLMALEWDPDDKSQNAFQHLVRNFPELDAAGSLINEDIRKVSGEQILEITGLEPGALDLYQSSAPCQAFSIANLRRDAADDKNDLFYTSIEHVETLKPKVAVFENVKGMVSGAMRGKFSDIVSRFRAAGYRVNAWVLDAADYGAPQTRPRTWIIGVREDLGLEPSVPVVSRSKAGISDVLPHLDGHQRGQFTRDVYPGNLPCKTITKTPGFRVMEDGKPRRPTVEELRVLSTFPPDFEFIGSYTQIHERLGNSVLPLQMRVIADHLYETVIQPASLDFPNEETLPHSSDELDELSEELLRRALAA